MNTFGKVADEICFVPSSTLRSAQDRPFGPIQGAILGDSGYKTFSNGLKRAIPSSSCSSTVKFYEFIHKYSVKKAILMNLMNLDELTYCIGLHFVMKKIREWGDELEMNLAVIAQVHLSSSCSSRAAPLSTNADIPPFIRWSKWGEGEGMELCI